MAEDEVLRYRKSQQVPVDKDTHHDDASNDPRPFFSACPSPDEECAAAESITFRHTSPERPSHLDAKLNSPCSKYDEHETDIKLQPTMYEKCPHQTASPPAHQYNSPPTHQYNSPPAHQYNSPPAYQYNSPPPMHNWREEHAAEGEFFDDGTMTYFWRAHTLTALFLMVVFLLYEALSAPVEDVVDNTKRGLVAVVSCFILLAVTVTPDGPFKRPHPAVWRLTFTCSIVYELALIFMLYQSASNGRRLLKHFDPTLGVPAEEKDYGGNCLLYDSDHPDNPYHNIWDKMDLFVPLHLIGWWLKTLLVRDWWLCWVISVMFEMLEYTLEHQLPNFSECWWDHWIMDALVCNGLGIHFGIKTLNYFSMKTYHWRGLWNIPSYRGKLRRILGQFGPFVWVDYDWKPFSSLGRWCGVLALICMFLLVELNTFYLKFVLWIPPGHWINLCRLLLVLPWGAVALRETFEFLDNPDVDKIGRQSWLFIAVICTELLIVIKFGWETVTIPIPGYIAYFWLCIITLLLSWTLWHFYIDPHTLKVDDRLSEDTRRLHWTQVRAIETKLSPSDSSADFLSALTTRLKTRIADTITTLTAATSAGAGALGAAAGGGGSGDNGTGGGSGGGSGGGDGGGGGDGDGDGDGGGDGGGGGDGDNCDNGDTSDDDTVDGEGVRNRKLNTKEE